MELLQGAIYRTFQDLSAAGRTLCCKIVCFCSHYIFRISGLQEMHEAFQEMIYRTLMTCPLHG